MPDFPDINSVQRTAGPSSVTGSTPITTGQLTGATASPLSGPSSHYKEGVIFAPFASEDIISQAMEQNLTRANQGKALRPIICQNNQDKALLEQYRQSKLECLRPKTAFASEVKTLMDKGLTEGQMRQAYGAQAYDTALNHCHTFCRQVDVLKHMEIRSNEDQQALSKLQPERHKLYITGHGGAGLNFLAADAKCTLSTVSAKEIAQQLSTGGLSPAFHDIRVTACFSADTKEPTSFKHKKLLQAAQPDIRRTGFLGLFGKKEIKAEPFAQTLSNELKKARFQQPDVAGYHGAGVTMAGNNEDHHQRRLPDSQVQDTRASSVRQRFTPTEKDISPKAK